VKHHLIAAGALVALAIGAPGLAAPASAADLAVKAPVLKAPPPAPVYDWSGIYIGGHAGYLWGSARVTEDGVVTEPHAAVNGFVGGALAGARWQTGNIVWGVEGDIGWADARGTGATAVVIETPNKYDINWTAHVRGTIGFASQNTLFFLAGGLAVADFRFTPGEDIGLRPEGAKFVGWSIGGGMEYGFTP